MRCKNSALFVFLGLKVQLHEMQKFRSLCLFKSNDPVARDAKVALSLSGSNDEKTRGRKSLRTVPLSLKAQSQEMQLSTFMT